MSTRVRVLMLVWTNVATDTRVLREATSLANAGYAVHVIGRAVPQSFRPPSGVTVASVGVGPRSAGRTRTLSAPERAARWLLLPQHVARSLTSWQAAARQAAMEHAARNGIADIVHAHDFTALPVGVDLARAWGAPLVYDTHEYWVGRPIEGRPVPARRRQERELEAALGAGAAAVITVGEGVARALARDHPDWVPVDVVRNTFPDRPPGGPVNPAQARGGVYAGRLAADRELEVLASASQLTDLPLTALGPADDAWLNRFDAKAMTVLGPEPLSLVTQRLIDAGIALVTHSDRWPNHRLALPNKLFHAISCGVPVVATDVGELGALVRATSVGTLYRPGDSRDAARAIEDVRSNYTSFRQAVETARPQLSWGRDEERLLAVYERVLDRSGR
ncbi:MAG: glycosyltransferase [Nostocoides sp.]